MPYQADKAVREAGAIREAKLEEAQKAFESKQCKTITEAAVLFNVPYSTLRRRILCLNQSSFKANQPRRLLTEAEEAALVDWLIFLGNSGHAVSKRSLRPIVETICGVLPSFKWASRFMVRHPEIKLARPSGLDPKRAQAFNFTAVSEHFKLLSDTLSRLDIPWENVYNMDEKGLQLGGGRKGRREKYFFARSQRIPVKLQAGSLQLVTVVESVCADGSCAPPGFVFSGSSFSPEWFQTPGNYSVATTENGWTNDFVCADWFEKVFIPYISQRNLSGKPMLLILDGHGSHLTDRMIELAIKHNVHLFCLPPHTTHRLQPLDVGVFGPLQRRWEERCDAVVNMTGESIQIADVVTEYLGVREKSFQEQTILAAWAKTGIRPINPSIFVPDDFAPSADTSTESHLPPSFPTAMPHFPDLSSDDYEWHPAMGINNRDGNSSDSSDSNESDTTTSSSNQTSTQARHTNTTGGTSNHRIPTPPAEAERSHSPADEQFTTDSQIRALQTPSDSLRRTRSTSTQATSTSSSSSVRGLTLSEAWNEIRHLRGQVKEIEAQRDSAEAHCVLAQRELSTLKFRLNRKQKRKDRRFRTGSTLVTSEEGLRLWEEEKRRREEKELEEVAVQAEKKRTAEERNIQRCTIATTGTFSGSLKTKKKSELEDIASAFGLSFDGTKATLTLRIVEHMDRNSDLETNPRFSGLFAAQKRPTRALGTAMSVESGPLNQVQATNVASSSGSNHIINELGLETNTSVQLHNIHHAPSPSFIPSQPHFPYGFLQWPTQGPSSATQP